MELSTGIGTRDNSSRDNSGMCGQTSKPISGKAACSTVRWGATITDMDLRSIDRSSVIPGRSNLAGAAQ